MATEILRASPRRTLVLILTVFVLRGVLAIAIIPPWQHPDEPQHFANVHILARQELRPLVARAGQINLSERIDLDLEQRILWSMSTHGWWRHYGEPEPNSFPEDFTGVNRHIWRVEDPPRAYYVLGAAGLALTSLDSLLAQYYLLRWMALALAVPTVVCVWAGSRRLFGVHVAAGATLLTALHPQFVLMSTAVNPDILVYLCGAVVWWQAARLLTGGSAGVSMALMAFATLIGVLTKRAGVPLVLMLFLVPAVALRFGRPGTFRVVGPSVSVLAGGLALVGLTAAFWSGDGVDWLTDYWGHLTTYPLVSLNQWFPPSVIDIHERWAYFQRFTQELFDSAWLMAGWLRYPAPPGWLLIIRLLTVGAVAGCVIGSRRPGMVQWRTGLALAGALVLAQVISIYGGLFMRDLGAQGRFLFPVIGPFMALFWVGIHSWWPQRVWPLVGAGLLSVMFALDVVGWLGVLVPAYVR